MGVMYLSKLHGNRAVLYTKNSLPQCTQTSLPIPFSLIAQKMITNTYAGGKITMTRIEDDLQGMLDVLAGESKLLDHATPAQVDSRT